MTTTERRTQAEARQHEVSILAPEWNIVKEAHLADTMDYIYDKLHKAGELYADVPTLGCDPEFMLWHKERKCYVSAHNLVPGTKQEPHWFEHGLGSVQSDGTAVEIGIKPAFTAEQFEANIYATLKSVDELLGAGVYDFRAKAAHVWESRVWKELPDAVKIIGCSPAFNNFTGIVLPAPLPHEAHTYYGGHIHIGFRNPAAQESSVQQVVAEENKRILCQLDSSWQNFNALTNSERRAIYPQSNRPKPYGVEWRTPSSGWLSSPSPDRYKMVFYSVMYNLASVIAGNTVADDPKYGALCRDGGDYARYFYGGYPRGSWGDVRSSHPSVSIPVEKTERT